MSAIVVSKTLSRPLGEYNKLQQDYILAARYAKKYGIVFNQGDAVRMIPAKNYPYGVAVFHDISDLLESPDVDWDKVISRQIKNKVEDLLPLVRLDWKEIAGQRRLL